MYFEKTYPISSMDLDCFDCCRASAVLGYLQDAAGLAAGQFGASNAEMVKKHGHCWMVVRTAFTMTAPLHWGDRLTVKTWHRGGDKPLMYRDFDLFSQHERIGEATSIWVLVDVKEHAITRAGAFPEFEGTDGGKLIRDAKLPKLKLPAELSPAGTRALHYSDTDANGHVNNTRYGDFLCDAAGMEKAPAGSFVRALYLSYLKECRAGEELALFTAREGDKRFVLGQDAGGGARFHGFVVF